MHRTHGASVGIRALVAHDSHRHYRKQHSKGLPNLGVKPGILDFADHDVVGLTKNRQAFWSDFAENTDCQPRSWKRLPLQNLFGHPQVTADPADFILKQIL